MEKRTRGGGRRNTQMMVLEDVIYLMYILVYQSLLNIGSGKMEVSILVTYVRLVHFQGSYEK